MVSPLLSFAVLLLSLGWAWLTWRVRRLERRLLPRAPKAPPRGSTVPPLPVGWVERREEDRRVRRETVTPRAIVVGREGER